MWIFFKNGRFSGRIWPDWGNTALADMAGLGSIGITYLVGVDEAPDLEGPAGRAYLYEALIIPEVPDKEA